MSSPFTVFRRSFRHFSDASPVTNPMNSDTHSCIVSFASFDTFAFAGKVFFMIRPTFAIGSHRSCSRKLSSSFNPPGPEFSAILNAWTSSAYTPGHSSGEISWLSAGRTLVGVDSPLGFFYDVVPDLTDDGSSD
nr:uncharacterized protein A4U43_UnF9640 [Ipomoea trifida]